MIRHKLEGEGFEYLDESIGERIEDEDVVERIRALAIPPAWKDVWICPAANGHIQATGVDARGRRQYRYHDAWRLQRDLAKHDRILDFASSSHLAVTAQRIFGTRPASLARLRTTDLIDRFAQGRTRSRT